MLNSHGRKTAIRSALKHKGYTAVNLFGLTIGLTCFCILMLYIQDELSYDGFHQDADRIYRVSRDTFSEDGSKTPTVYTETALVAAMVQGVPEIEAGTRIARNRSWGKAALKYAQDTYYDDRVLYIDDTFFDLFSFDFVEGDAETALEGPTSIVLTESLAKKFFGDRSALGKALTFDHRLSPNAAMQVTGVVSDPPAQSHFTFDFLVSIKIVPNWREPNWHGDNTIASYIKVAPGVSVDELQGRIQRLVQESKPTTRDRYVVQPLIGLDGIHLSSHRGGELGTNSDTLYIKVLFIAALFVVLIAGINYINLTTAKAATRAREIGVRKVVGAVRQDLMRQFLTESVLMCAAAGVAAVGLTEAALPFFNSMMQKQLSLFAATSQPIWLLFGAVTLAIGLLAGAYPALYLSSFRPISVLKSSGATSRTRFGLRQGLVVFQFGLAALLMVGVTVVQQQMNYIRSADLGFDQDQVIIIKNFTAQDPNFVIRQTLADLPGVVNVGASGQNVGVMDQSWLTSINVLGSDNKQPVMWGAYIDHNYLDVLGIKLKAGRGFVPERDIDPRGRLGNTIILNETAVRQLDIPEPVLGQQLVVNRGEYTLVGVVEDFHATSLHDEVLPMAFVFYHKVRKFVAIKVAGGDVRATLEQVEDTWSTLR